MAAPAWWRPPADTIGRTAVATYTSRRQITARTPEKKPLVSAHRNCRRAPAGAWVVPGAGLALLPKCPACLAGFVAAWTGFGLSFSAATHLRTFVLVLCAVTLLCLAFRRVQRLVAKGLSDRREP
jgi:hypothetical protein